MIGLLATLALFTPQAIDLDCVITAKAATPLLRYQDHPSGVWRGRPAPVKLDSAFSRLFRTQLTKGAARGPNFAGHLTVVTWGCGSSCVEWAVVDARTGSVTRLTGMDVVATLHVGDGLAGVDYRLDSDLLIVSGAPQEDLGREGVYALLWRNGAFEKAGYLPRAKSCEKLPPV